MWTEMETSDLDVQGEEMDEQFSSSKAARFNNL
jgi:hypothetical protein